MEWMRDGPHFKWVAHTASGTRLVVESLVLSGFLSLATSVELLGAPCRALALVVAHAWTRVCARCGGVEPVSSGARRRAGLLQACRWRRVGMTCGGLREAGGGWVGWSGVGEGSGWGCGVCVRGGGGEGERGGGGRGAGEGGERKLCSHQFRHFSTNQNMRRVSTSQEQ